MTIKRALISVSDKNGLATFAAGLAELGIQLISTSGTATFLSDAGLAVTTVEELTGASELLGGRVKTLHPHIHAGILARRNHPEDMASLEQQGIVPIDLVVCNLYPFRQVANRRGVTEPEVIANIDVGGPTMVRAAAKNFDSVGGGDRPRALRVRAGRAAQATAASCRRRRAASWRPRRSRIPRATTPRSPSGSARPSRSPSGWCSTWSRPATWPTARTPTSGPPTTSRPARAATCCR